MRTLDIIHKERGLRACITAKVPPNETLLSVHVCQCQSLVPVPLSGSHVTPVLYKLPPKHAHVYGVIAVVWNDM